MKISTICILSLCAISFNVYGKTSNKVYNPEVKPGMYILTPKAGEKPHINSAKVFGVRPSSPFLYTIVATGNKPITFSCNELPAGLKLDEKSGIISGTITSTEKQTYNVELKAKNSKGLAKQKLQIVVGDEICLTPPLGWNGWNCWGRNISQASVEASAKAMCEKGLKDYGWSYINIDDAWQGNERGGKHNAIIPDKTKFPDMQGMCDFIHSLGLKVGIYSTPWITTYAKFIGSSSNNKDGKWDVSMQNGDSLILGKYHFEQNDAAQWAEWGMDYLKYDWNPNDAASTIRMANALRNSGRDIVFSLSNTCPIDLMPVCSKYVQAWRTTGDLKDRWNQDGPHKNICDVLPLHRKWVNEVYEGKPGHYADPDMLVVGYINRGVDKEMTPTTLTADEQYSHIALWSLWSAPMLIGCPIERMDDFTVSLLTNSEVLEIQQDPLCIPGKSVTHDDNKEIIVKNLYNGDKAVGIFNMSDATSTLTITWDEIGVAGTQELRDVWRQKNIGNYSKSFTATVPSHGNILLHLKKK